MNNRKGLLKILFMPITVLGDVFYFFHYDPYNQQRLLLQSELTERVCAVRQQVNF